MKSANRSTRASLVFFGRFRLLVGKAPPYKRQSAVLEKSSGLPKYNLGLVLRLMCCLLVVHPTMLSALYPARFKNSHKERRNLASFVYERKNL